MGMKATVLVEDNSPYFTPKKELLKTCFCNQQKEDTVGMTTVLSVWFRCVFVLCVIFTHYNLARCAPHAGQSGIRPKSCFATIPKQEVVPNPRLSWLEQPGPVARSSLHALVLKLHYF